jgi:hypothetical protein
MRFITYYGADRAFVPGGGGAGGAGVTTFTAPANVYFVRITITHSDLATFQLEVGSVATAFEPFALRLTGPDGTPILPVLPDSSVSAAALAAAIVSPVKTTFLVLGKNLFNKAAATIGYFQGPTGAPIAGATYDLSDFMPVTAGQTYYGRGAAGMRFTTYYDANKVNVPGGASVEVSSFVAPAGVAFVKVSIFHTDLASFQFEQSATQTAYEAYGYKFTSDVIGGATASVVSGWANKTWASLGDSITAGATWQAMVASALGLIPTNFGIGGTKVSGPAGDANAMCQDARINAIPTTVELITMMGGTNDWAQNVPLGADNSTDPLTFNGALNTFAAKAFARWPGKRIALATTPYGEIPDWTGRTGWTSPAHNSLGLTTNEYAVAIRKACERLNFHCIDVARSAGWGTYNITEAMGGSLTDHLHPAAASLAAKGIAAAHRGALRAIEPVA